MLTIEMVSTPHDILDMMSLATFKLVADQVGCDPDGSLHDLQATEKVTMSV